MADFIEGEDPMVGKNRHPKSFVYLLAFVIFLQTGCGNIPGRQAAVTMTTVPSTETPKPILPSATATQTPVPRVVISPVADGELTDVQKALINYSTELKTWTEGSHDYWKYWSGADEPEVRSEWLQDVD